MNKMRKAFDIIKMHKFHRLCKDIIYNKSFINLLTINGNF